MTKATNYQIGCFVFIPQRRLLISENSQSSLDGKQAAILLYFAQHPQTLITREQFTDEVWNGRYVADHVLNTKISELRKLFKDDYKNPQFFKTHHQRGYELIASCHAIDKNEVKKSCEDGLLANISLTEPKLALPKNKSQRGKILWFSLISVLISLVLLTIFLPPELDQATHTSSNALFQLKPITSERGQEWAPNITDNGRFLAYAQLKDNEATWQIKIKDLTNSEIFSLTDDNFANQSPTWSRSGDKLFFIRGDVGFCQIMEADVSAGFDAVTVKKLTYCGDQQSLSPMAVGNNDEWLYFSSLIKGARFVLMRINLLNGIEETLSIPPRNSFGDYSLALSPDGKQLAFLRAAGNNKSTLMLLGINSRELKSLRQFDHMITRVSWDVSNQHINFIDESSNLIQLELRSNTSKLLIAFQNKMLYPYYGAGKTFVVDGGFYAKEIISTELNEQFDLKHERIEVSSSYDDSLPAINSVNQMMVFSSNRSGIAQIWLKDKKRERKLTDFAEFGVIDDIHFSPDGLSLLFIRNQKLHLLEIATRHITNLLPTHESVRSPIWSCNGKRILVPSQQNGTWNLYALELTENITSKLLTDVLSIKSDCGQNDYYVMRTAEHNISKLSDDLRSVTQEKMEYFTAYGNQWDIVGGRLYKILDGNFQRIEISSGLSTITPLPKGKIFSFRIDHDMVFFSRKLFQENDIKQLISL